MGSVKRPKQYAELGYVQKALQYCRDVTEGTIPACEWVKLACQRQLNDLEKAKNQDPTFPYTFDIAKAERVCLFIEQLKHLEGPKAGQLIVLEPWQCFFLTTVFGWVHAQDDPARGVKQGKRRFRRVYAEIPRGNGKSLMSSGVLLYMSFADGEGGAQCYAVATSVEQAQAVYRPATVMVDNCLDLQNTFGVKKAYLRIVQESTASFCKALPYKRDGKLDSLNVHLAVVDELHAHDIRDAYEAMETGMGKRDQSLLWTITTAGTNQAGICFEKHKYVKRILRKEMPQQDESFFGIIYTLDPGDDWNAEESWAKANPNWNISVSSVVVRGLAFQATQLPSAQVTFKTKHLNIWENADSNWMNMQKWNACQDKSLMLEDFTEDECILGLDLASRQDLAACLKVFRRMGEEEKWHYYIFGTYWLPEESHTVKEVSAVKGWIISGILEKSPGDTTDYDAIEDNISEFAKGFKVREVAYDPYMASQLVKHLQDQLGEEAVIEVKANVANFSPAMKELESLVLEKRIHHNDPVLSWNIANVVCHLDEKQNIYPRKGNKNDPNCKIDAVVALIMAIHRWTAYADEDGPGYSGSGPSIHFFGGGPAVPMF